MAAELKATAEQVAALRLEAKQAVDESAAAATVSPIKVKKSVYLWVVDHVSYRVYESQALLT